MTKSNKGRFKCKDEAQAVWLAMLGFHKSVGGIDFEKDWLSESEMAEMTNEFAEVLYQARLIKGSIYGDDWRIEDKDVAHAEYLAGVFDVNLFSSDEPCKYGDDPRIFNQFIFSRQNTEIIGTIFY